ncbi:hypothetical protein Ahy_A07g032908 [Arachis hypogaea]|uniref:Endonuclease/exonuclease/phosphatase domain-containing protein n=1 Tax=Arachis hypogaea TaxID=3818 RepID=A0A445C7V0_ARAHY|nr:hypothetical protein Ahy_A07g032908 [Arachis hypogaea]
MNLLSWNCRGVTASSTMAELRNICKFNKPSVVFLMETRAKEGRINTIRRKLCFDKSFCVELWGLFGGLCILWKSNVNINILSWCDNFITAKIGINNGESWKCIFVYGNPIFRKRKNLWRNLTANNWDQEAAQIYIGDFNEVLTQEENVGLHLKPRGQLEEFKKFLNDNRLMDLDLKGNKFTWFSNPKNGFVTRERIDRVLVNWQWREKFQHAILEALPAINHEECCNVINKGWNKEITRGTAWTNIIQRMKNCKEELRKWSRTTFKRTDKEILKMKKELRKLQNSCLEENK